ncbi:MAG: GNAT family N-acetyltransferase [Eubacteriales bacterium]|nr:GNAT family N-acetyltransferase [Eubacteriales bacterium]
MEIKEKVLIRRASEEDAQAILDVYAPYIKNTAITFEYEVPSLEEFRERIRSTLKKYPYLVAEKEGEILGYAYTGAFVGRAACDWSVETSIYLKETGTKMGVGKMLYNAIEKISKAQNIVNLNACIAVPDTEDEHLNFNSAQFHAHLGYQFVGKFHKCGYKFENWYNLIWMEKTIGEHKKNPEPFIPFSELKEDLL